MTEPTRRIAAKMWARRSRWLVPTLGALVVLVVAMLVVTVLFAVRVMESAPFLEGTDVSEQGLTRKAQIDMIDRFAPIPTPNEATDVRLSFRRFQDWRFEGSFALPSMTLESYVAQLGERRDQGQDGWETYPGKRIGPHVGSVRVQRATGRVVVYHASS